MMLAVIWIGFIVCVIFMLFIILGGPQIIATMYISRQYSRVLSAWYQRTNPDDPMPIFDGIKSDDNEGGLDQKTL